MSRGRDEHVRVDSGNLSKYLGVIKYRYGEAEEQDHVGVTTGLAWTEVGGDILFIEAVDMPGKGKITQTGKLGDVMKESIETAYSVVRRIPRSWGLIRKFSRRPTFMFTFRKGRRRKTGRRRALPCIRRWFRC